MEVQISAKTLKKLQKRLGSEGSRDLGVSAWRYAEAKDDTVIELPIADLSVPVLTTLRDVMAECSETQARRVSQLINALSDPSNKRIPSLQALPSMLDAYFKKNLNKKRPWLFSLHADLRGVAFLPLEATHVSDARGNPHVRLELAYNTKLRYRVTVRSFSRSDIDLTVPELLKEAGLVIPDDDMFEEYDKLATKMQKLGGKQAEQFWVRREAPVDSGNDYWWASDTVNLSLLGKPSKAVLDMEIRDPGSTKLLATTNFFDDRKSVPEHPVLRLFSLAHHQFVWVNVHNIREYGYEKGLQNKLVLPSSHTTLVRALVSNLDVLRIEAEAEDRSRTIRAKARSSIILAKGAPGTGKTLTAEVYAEEIERPLYEVQSGQIGSEPEEIETNLKVILERSTRLRMPLLINEADIFVQKRGRDFQTNAIVSVFLRLLEYHDGLVFLTTNRPEDIDDAVINRCIAAIEYGPPKTEEERRKLWEVQLAEFNVSLSERQLDKVVRLFPKIVGRDVQNLIRLTSRVCKATGTEFSVKALCENAVFRSIEIAENERQDKPA